MESGSSGSNSARKRQRASWREERQAVKYWRGESSRRIEEHYLPACVYEMIPDAYQSTLTYEQHWPYIVPR